MRLVLGAAVASSALAFATPACSSFTANEAPRDAGAEGGPDGASQQEDAGACVGGHDGGFVCGDGLCTKGQTCCMQQTPICTGVNDCGTTQRNCLSPAECTVPSRCCQASPGSNGSKCLDACPAGAATLCAKDVDCGAGEACRPPRADVPFWHCEPCPH